MEKTGNKNDIPPRASLLAQPDFFPGRYVFEKIVFAEIPVLEGVMHGVAVNLENHTLYCTCPFRPKPCVHGLALKALFDREAGDGFIQVDELPEWVEVLFSGGAAEGVSPAFAKASAGKKEQRRFERLERAANGFEDLEAWLLDTARRGLATVVSEDPKWWEGIAGRMADASMTGLSRTLRLLGQIPAAAPDWADRTAAVMADCYLAVRAFRKRDSLPEVLLYDLQNFIGINTKKEEVIATGEKVNDIWAVVGQLEEQLEEKLTMRRTWLLGAKTNRFALLLDYSFGSDGMPPGFEPGSIRQGVLAFYPSAYPLRALVPVEPDAVPKKVEKLPGFEDFDLLAKKWAAALAAQPWLQFVPAMLHEVAPLRPGDKFIVVDKNEKALPLHVAEITGWRLIALSGGAPIGIFGEWNGGALRPLSAVAAGRFVHL